jgi:hypothetical protein
MALRAALLASKFERVERRHVAFEDFELRLSEFGPVATSGAADQQNLGIVEGDEMEVCMAHKNK